MVLTSGEKAVPVLGVTEELSSSELGCQLTGPRTSFARTASTFLWNHWSYLTRLEYWGNSTLEDISNGLVPLANSALIASLISLNVYNLLKFSPDLCLCTSRYWMLVLSTSLVPGSRGSGLALCEKTILSTSYWMYSLMAFFMPGMLKSGIAKKITWLGVARSAMYPI